MRMTLRSTLAAAAGVALFSAMPAAAAPFLFNFYGTGFFGGTLNGTGTLTTDGNSFVNALNGYTAQRVTGITGMFNGSDITGLSTVFGANNLYYLSGPFFVDGQGISFTTASGGSANLFITNSTSYRVNAGGLLTGLVTASSMAAPGAVPEPASWAMMIVGMGAIGFAMRRRQKVTTRVSYAG